MTTVKEHVHKINTTAPDTETRSVRRMEIGTVLHQGDVYLHRVDDSHPRGDALRTMQVAVGDSQGSRHIVTGSATLHTGKQLPRWVSVPGWTTAGELLGPVIIADGPWALRHPDHTDHEVECDGVYQVTYQADYSTRRRVTD